MPELTDRARRNLARGANSGAGTGVCVVCGGTKESTRLNSAQCRRCGSPAPSTTALKITLSPAVMAALAAEAAAHDQTPAERVTYLLTRKYTAKKKE